MLPVSIWPPGLRAPSDLTRPLKKHVREFHVGPGFLLNPYVGNRTHQVDMGDEQCAHRAEPLVVSRCGDGLFIYSDVC